jgi:hypothetical protein
LAGGAIEVTDRLRGIEILDASSRLGQDVLAQADATD